MKMADNATASGKLELTSKDKAHPYLRAPWYLIPLNGDEQLLLLQIQCNHAIFSSNARSTTANSENSWLDSFSCQFDQKGHSSGLFLREFCHLRLL
jgi:hypothetical protein